MPDITKCSNSRCVKRLNCYRFISVPSSPVQAVDIFVPENNNVDGFRCDMMMGHGHALSILGDLFIDLDKATEGIEQSGLLL